MSGLPTSVLGRTNLTVTRLGFGAMELRGGAAYLGRDVDDETADRVLNGVLDAGINLIDTAPDYGLSEERIGRYVSARREEFVLASKCGCAVNLPGLPGGFGTHDFSPANIRAGVEQSLRRMHTDRLDIVQVHVSPPRSVLEADDSIGELVALRDEGKIRFLGMSGTLPEIVGHIEMDVFDVFQIPYSALERNHYDVIVEASNAGAGIIVRGGVARGVASMSPENLKAVWDPYRSTYVERRDRFEQARLDDLLGEMTRMEFMLRYTLSHPSIDTTIVGTSDAGHLAANVDAARRGPLPTELYEEATTRLQQAL